MQTAALTIWTQANLASATTIALTSEIVAQTLKTCAWVNESHGLLVLCA